jgi:autotransporter family porin
MTAAPAARAATLLTLGTFHDRQGDQLLLDRPGEDPPGFTDVFDGSLAPVVWGRAFGAAVQREGSGPLDAQFNGHIFGAEIGADVAQFHLKPGDTDHVGVFYAYSDLSADGHAFVLAIKHDLYGSISSAAHNAGAYWSHIASSGWYADAVLMGSFYSETPHALLDTVSDLSGDGITGSLEGGYPFAITDSIELEPQAQLVWQTIHINPATDPFTTVAFYSDATITGRLGLQLQDNLNVVGLWVQPRLIANFWRTFAGNDTTLYQGVIPISAPFGSTTIEIGGGTAAYVDKHFSAYAQATYTTNVGGAYVQDIKGIIGLRYSW